jgi:hypothetical protein
MQCLTYFDHHPDEKYDIILFFLVLFFLLFTRDVIPK